MSLGVTVCYASTYEGYERYERYEPYRHGHTHSESRCLASTHGAGISYDYDTLVFLTFIVVIFHAGRYTISAANPITVFSFIHDLVQYNVAGVPLIHEQTQWDFEPEVGKQRRVKYEQENGRHGEIAIAKIGMGIGL
ncbi:uncharacterized protein LOC128873592 [Hylaeus volcanicus]|uniref:uncharacterized protein LOC128873592 n=1 Tax=Hylaeus volcanicus TaxID=313075 RepID=UPI0023B82CB1|nr:uncharacterized protein LOC128873592 [Hylaeus volcanicus]